MRQLWQNTISIPRFRYTRASPDAGKILTSAVRVEVGVALVLLESSVDGLRGLLDRADLFLWWLGLRSRGRHYRCLGNRGRASIQPSFLVLVANVAVEVESSTDGGVRTGRRSIEVCARNTAHGCNGVHYIGGGTLVALGRLARIKQRELRRRVTGDGRWVAGGNAKTKLLLETHSSFLPSYPPMQSGAGARSYRFQHNWTMGNRRADGGGYLESDAGVLFCDRPGLNHDQSCLVVRAACRKQFLEGQSKDHWTADLEGWRHANATPQKSQARGAAPPPQLSSNQFCALLPMNSACV